MITFLYQLPFWIIGLSTLYSFYCFSKKVRYNNVLEIDEDKIILSISTIPTLLVILAFWIWNPNFGALYVPWLIYLIFIVLNITYKVVIYQLRSKKADEKIDSFRRFLSEQLEKAEKEEKNK